MPRGRGDNAPNTYVSSGTWPEATLRPDAPVEAHYAQQLARRLAAAMTERPISNRALAKLAGVTHPTIGFILNGDHHADVSTVARLEVALGADLYPAGLHQHLTTQQRQPSAGNPEPTAS
ncbi:helix-turn-helix domain-containing protein [Plantactinospora sp. CA-290183]|uniref:helix-turn-helix domain-containing protein n=1 Tax=Plantactinospora sp. CA-290183 TaxID=3240006 RepID=UPI003D89CEEC